MSSLIDMGEIKLTTITRTKGVLLLSIVAATALLVVLLSIRNIGADSGLLLDYPWSAEEQAKRQLAIAQRDSSLLPQCTDEYVEWRSATEEARRAADGLMPPSPDFWSAPGCRARVDFEVLGPKGSPMQDHVEDDKWWIGQSISSSENDYDQGVYSKIEIDDVGVDHSTKGDFFAARVMAIVSGGSLEAGWVEGPHMGDSDQHIYSQSSLSCHGEVCIWSVLDDDCNNNGQNIQVAVAAISSTQWRSSCWDGEQWQAMHDNQGLGDDDAIDLEIIGEITRTVSGEMDLTGSGINFSLNQVRNSSDWDDWDDDIYSGTHLDLPYQRDEVSGWEEFNVTNSD